MSRGDVGKKATKPEKVKDATIGMICARCGAPAEYIATWQHPAQPVDGRRSGWLEQVALCTEHAAEAIDTDPPPARVAPPRRSDPPRTASRSRTTRRGGQAARRSPAHPRRRMGETAAVIGHSDIRGG